MLGGRQEGEVARFGVEAVARLAEPPLLGVHVAGGRAPSSDVGPTELTMLVIPAAAHHLARHRALEELLAELLPPAMPAELEVLRVAGDELRLPPRVRGIEDHRDVVRLPVAVDPRQRDPRPSGALRRRAKIALPAPRRGAKGGRRGAGRIPHLGRSRSRTAEGRATPCITLMVVAT